jgi:hypothetical protein
MTRAILSVAALAYFAAFFVSPASALEKPKDAAGIQPNLCDVYGPGYEPVGATGVCIKITGSVELGVTASFPSGHPPVANSPDWLRTKPAKGGN